MKLATKAFRKKSVAGRGEAQEGEEEEEESPGLFNLPGGALANPAPDYPT